MKKRIILPALALGILTTAGFWGANQALANGGEFHEGLVQRLTEKFGLNQTEVEEVMSEYRGEHRGQMQAERQSQREESLSQAVSDGKITQAQKDSYLAKMAELQANRPALADLTPEEHQANKESHRAEMETWAEANGLDLDDLHPLMGKGLKGDGQHRGGFGRGFSK